MQLVLTIRGEQVDQIEMDYRGCLNYAAKTKRNREYAEYFKKHYWQELMITWDWSIELVAESKMDLKKIYKVTWTELKTSEG